MDVPVSPNLIHNPDAFKDPGPGEHLWIMTAAFRASEDMVKRMAEGKETEGQHLDHESLLTLEGPGCFKCEKPFSKRMYYRKCTGGMEVQ
jgi:hypothetical protein